MAMRSSLRLKRHRDANGLLGARLRTLLGSCFTAPGSSLNISQKTLRTNPVLTSSGQTSPLER